MTAVDLAGAGGHAGRAGRAGRTAPAGDRDAAALLGRQTAILEQMAAGAPLTEVLTGIAATLEELVPGCACSVLLLDAGAGVLRHGAAPSLPTEYLAGIDGMTIGAGAGSCGSAAWSGQAVVAADIRRDPRWADFLVLAERFGLRACWSTPITGRRGICGTFAVYHRTPHRPTPREELLVERLTHLASVAIDHDGVRGALAESEERFRRAFEDNAVGMALATLDGGVTRVNRALRMLLGRAEGDLVGRRLDDLLTRRGDGPTTDPHGTYEAVTHTAGGRSLDVEVTVSPIRDAVDTPQALSVNVLDVTGRRAAERERDRRVEAESARSAAEAANRAKTDFVAALGHELRTPVQAITGFTELLTTLELDDDHRSAALHHITAAAHHILAMVGDVLDVARIESRALPLTIRDVALPPVVSDVLQMVEPLATASRVTLSAASTAPSPPVPLTVRADERRVRQVLLNLVTNAIRYSGAGAEISVRCEVRDARVRVSVRDTGPGIAAEHLDRLFTPFDRLGRDTEEGVGLGLPLARGLTEAMGGELTVDSAVGRGTTVALWLPAASINVSSTPPPSD